MPLKLITTKKELLKRTSKRDITKCAGCIVALKAWNYINKIIRIKLIQTMWEGTAGFGRCEGTSKEQAAKNCALQKASTKTKVDVKNFEEVKVQYLLDIKALNKNDP